MAKPETVTDLPVTLKLTTGARSLGMTPREFRALWDQHGLPVLRPSARRERILQNHLYELCEKIAGPAQRESHAA